MIMEKKKLRMLSISGKWVPATFIGLALTLSGHSLPVWAENSEAGVLSKTLQSKAENTDVALPSPLTLEFLIDGSYPLQTPKIRLQDARLQQAQSMILSNQVSTNWQADVEGRLAWREFSEETQDHHLLALHLGKVLYDFNRNDLAVKAAEKNREAEEGLTDSVLNQQRLTVMQAFFNVLLSDFQYRVDNEAMAVAYISLEKVQDLHAVGQRSDVELLEEEYRYQKVLVVRTRSESRQLQTRVQLANAIDQPDARPGEFTLPDLKAFAKRSLKDLNLQQLQEQVLQQSPKLQAMSQRLEGQRLALDSALAVGRPTVRADAWAGKLSSYPELREGSWHAQLSINIPLYDGGNEAAAVATAKANLAMGEAEYQQLSQTLRAEATELYFQLNLLQAEKNEYQAFGDYGDLYLDYSRALYENESTTDLGDSMVRLSQANYDQVAWQFKQALLWSQIDYLMGKKVGLENDNHDNSDDKLKVSTLNQSLKQEEES